MSAFYRCAKYRLGLFHFSIHNLLLCFYTTCAVQSTCHLLSCEKVFILIYFLHLKCTSDKNVLYTSI